MILPNVKDPDRYVGLYVVDFGDHSQVGLTTEQVAEVLDSESAGNLRVYKIHRAFPDGRLELKGVCPEVFQMEAGMFFYARDEKVAREDFERLCRLAESTLPPARAKVYLSSDNNGGFVTALIYPAEYDEQFSRWLLDIGYRTLGAVEGGTAAVGRYYDGTWDVLEKKQLWPAETVTLLNTQTVPKTNRQVGM